MQRVVASADAHAALCRHGHAIMVVGDEHGKVEEEGICTTGTGHVEKGVRRVGQGRFGQAWVGGWAGMSVLVPCVCAFPLFFWASAGLPLVPGLASSSSAPIYTC